MNILTFDVEEWFHILDNDSTRTAKQWENYEVRIYENMERIFNLLEETNTKATFFIIGWIAKKYPDIVKMIAEKYTIGSHTMNHQLVWQQSHEDFKKDVTSSIKLLEDITGKKVNMFRAPGFSIRETEGWAIDILKEAGIEYDSSVFPAKASHGGMPSFKEHNPSILDYNGVQLKEFPIPVHFIFGKPMVYCGGGYFRFFPYNLIKKWASDQGYVLSYIHPRDLDAGQPMLNDLSFKRKFKSYVGLKSSEKKLRKFLTDFDFSDISTASLQIDWNNVPIVKI